MVNRQCELFELNDRTLDQFKCLTLVMGLKPTTEYDIRIKLLNKLEKESDKITLDLLSAVCQRIINLKKDTVHLENK